MPDRLLIEVRRAAAAVRALPDWMPKAPPRADVYGVIDQPVVSPRPNQHQETP